MIRERQCLHCEHWDPRISYKYYPDKEVVAFLSGECQAGPPTPVYDGENVHAIWPKVAASDWCAAFSKCSYQISIDRLEVQADVDAINIKERLKMANSLHDITQNDDDDA